MSKIKYSILLLSLSSLLISCGYSFTLKGGGNLGKVNLLKSENQTPLRSSAIILDQYMENALSSYGLFSDDKSRPQLKCIVVSASSSEITANPIGTVQNRYRLTVTVRVELYDKDEKKIWENSFSDDGEYSTYGDEEDGMYAAFNKLSVRIAQTISALSI